MFEIGIIPEIIESLLYIAQSVSPTATVRQPLCRLRYIQPVDSVCPLFGFGISRRVDNKYPVISKSSYLEIIPQRRILFIKTIRSEQIESRNMQCLHERRARLLGSDTGTNQRRYTFQSKIEIIGVGKTGSIQAHYGRCILIRTRQRHVSETHDFDTFDRTMIKDIVLIPHARKSRIDLLGHVSVYIFSVTGIVHPEYRIDDNRLHAYRYTTTGAIVHSRVIDHRTIYDHRRVVGINTSAIGSHVIINYRTGNPAARS